METTTFNLIQIFALLQKQWKIISIFVLGSVTAASITVYTVPAYFKSTATVVSANPYLADKARLFNTNIQSLYSYFGSGDDLDRIYGIAEMDTTLKKLVDEFSLITYYKLDNDSLPLLRRKAVLLLRKDLSLQKTELAQVKIIVWTKNKSLSSAIANRMVAIIEETESEIWQKNYSLSLSKLTGSVLVKEQEYQGLSDGISGTTGGKRELGMAKMQSLLEQIKQYRKTADEYTLAAQTPPSVLYVMESAVPAAKAERPNKVAIILTAFLAAILFSCLVVLINDRKNMG